MFGDIINTKFQYVGNDALDFSGSNINISNINIIDAKDKAISAGEGTKIYCSDIFVEDCEIAITSKDDSSIYGNKINIINSKIDTAHIIKKAFIVMEL